MFCFILLLRPPQSKDTPNQLVQPIAASSVPEPQSSLVAVAPLASNQEKVKRNANALSTPIKRPAAQCVTTPAKTKTKKQKKDQIKPVPDGFGGLVAKSDHCKVCYRERDSDQIGGTCRYCLLACRKIFHHQRVAEIMSCEAKMAQLKEKSKVLRPKEKHVAARCSNQMFEQILLKLDAVMPRLENIDGRLQSLEEARVGKGKRTWSRKTAQDQSYKYLFCPIFMFGKPLAAVTF